MPKLVTFWINDDESVKLTNWCHENNCKKSDLIRQALNSIFEGEADIRLTEPKSVRKKDDDDEIIRIIDG